MVQLMMDEQSKTITPQELPKMKCPQNCPECLEDQHRLDWQAPAQFYLQRLAEAEFRAGVSAHKKRGLRPSTYRHNPSQYHRDLVELLGRNDEEGFKALKMLSGYASEVGV